MYPLTRKLSRHLKLWSIAAVAVLLFTAIINAGHIHSSLEEPDSGCTLCLHSVTLDKPLVGASSLPLPRPITSIITDRIDQLFSSAAIRSIAIRAPPITTPHLPPY
jgi:hypothetical protein